MTAYEPLDVAVLEPLVGHVADRLVQGAPLPRLYREVHDRVGSCGRFGRGIGSARLAAEVSRDL